MECWTSSTVLRGFAVSTHFEIRYDMVLDQLIHPLVLCLYDKPVLVSDMTVLLTVGSRQVV